MNNELFMQVHIAALYRKRHHLSIERFLELDRQCDFLGFVAKAYEPFHLTGDQGILDEMERYVRERRKAPLSS
jgi:hypothetical protein